MLQPIEESLNNNRVANHVIDGIRTKSKRKMKVQTSLKFDKELPEMAKEKAAAQKRSLNNYIEYSLYRDVGNIPNEETKKAIDEARHSKNLEPINDLQQFLKSI